MTPALQGGGVDGCEFGEVAVVDQRLDRMIEIADLLGVKLDLVVKHMGRCDQSTFEAFSESPSRLPR